MPDLDLAAMEEVAGRVIASTSGLRRPVGRRLACRVLRAIGVPEMLDELGAGDVVTDGPEPASIDATADKMIDRLAQHLAGYGPIRWGRLSDGARARWRASADELLVAAGVHEVLGERDRLLEEASAGSDAPFAFPGQCLVCGAGCQVATTIVGGTPGRPSDPAPRLTHVRHDAACPIHRCRYSSITHDVADSSSCRWCEDPWMVPW